MALGSVTSLGLNKSNKPARVAVPAVARNCRRGLRPLVIKKHRNCKGSTMQNGWLPSYQCELRFRSTEVQLPAEAEAPPLRYELVRSRVELVLVVLGTEIIGSAAVLGFETGISIHVARRRPGALRSICAQHCRRSLSWDRAILVPDTPCHRLSAARRRGRNIARLFAKPDRCRMKGRRHSQYFHLPPIAFPVARESLG